MFVVVVKNIKTSAVLARWDIAKKIAMWVGMSEPDSAEM